MGWLRALMDRPVPPLRSFDALAQRVLADVDWPTDSTIKPRSLAAIFSKLDRQLELEWLTDRPEAQAILARALRAPIDEIQAELRHRDSTGAGSRLRLDDLRYARALDLVDEPLCPGVPSIVLAPASWRRLFWIAPSGSGRSLVGQWLSARGLAEVLAFWTWEEALPTLTSLGANLEAAKVESAEGRPLFLELESSEGLSTLRELSGLGRPLCVAAPSAPVEAKEVDAWQLIRCPEPEEYLHALVTWVEQRLPAKPSGGARFDSAEVETWLRGGPLQTNSLRSLGALLGLCGLADEVGVRALTGKDLGAWAERICRQRLLESSGAGTQDETWLRKSGYRALLGMLGRALTDSDKPWDAGRTLDEWLALVPTELQKGADLEWVRAALSGPGVSVRLEELDRAARRMPPGAFRVVRAFERAGLLRRASDDRRLVLRPHWIGAVAEAQALRELVRGSHLEWGEALLRPSRSRDVLHALLERLREGDHEGLDDVVELSSDDNPAHVAALEASFLAVGLVLLERGTELPSDTLLALWDEALRLVLEFPTGAPERRIPHSGSDPLLSQAVWYLAALALSEQLPRGSGTRHPLLRPWLSTTPHPELPELLDAILRAVATAQDEASWVGSVYALVDRLRGVQGPASGRIDAPHPLECPGILVEEIQNGVAEWASIQNLHATAGSTAGFRHLARSSGLPSEAVELALWEAWARAGCPGAGEELSLLSLHHEGPFPEMSPDLFKAVLLEAPEGRLPHGRLSDKHWELLLAAAETVPSLAKRVEPWRYAPEAVAARVLLAPRLEPWSRQVFDTLARRFPKLFLNAILQRWSAEQGQRALWLLQSVPTEQARDLVVALGKRANPFELPERCLHDLRRWLYSLVMQRTSGWREAYALMMRIEEGLEPLRERRGGVS